MYVMMSFAKPGTPLPLPSTAASAPRPPPIYGAPSSHQAARPPALTQNSHENYTGPRPSEQALAAASSAPAAAAATATVPKADGKVAATVPKADGKVDGTKLPEKDPSKYLGPN